MLCLMGGRASDTAPTHDLGGRVSDAAPTHDLGGRVSDTVPTHDQGGQVSDAAPTNGLAGAACPDSPVAERCFWHASPSLMLRGKGPGDGVGHDARRGMSRIVS